jgi:small subunit ribosomal protein S17
MATTPKAEKGRSRAAKSGAAKSTEQGAADAAETNAAAPDTEVAAATTAGTAGSAGAAGPAARIRGRQQVKVGHVVSDKMDKTVIVTVQNTTTHRLYHRYMKRTSKFAAHDAENRCKVGDVVEIVSSRPLSKTKRWRVREILQRAE